MYNILEDIKFVVIIEINNQYLNSRNIRCPKILAKSAVMHYLMMRLGIWDGRHVAK